MISCRHVCPNLFVRYPIRPCVRSATCCSTRDHDTLFCGSNTLRYKREYCDICPHNTVFCGRGCCVSSLSRHASRWCGVETLGRLVAPLDPFFGISEPLQTRIAVRLSPSQHPVPNLMTESTPEGACRRLYSVCRLSAWRAATDLVLTALGGRGVSGAGLPGLGNGLSGAAVRGPFESSPPEQGLGQESMQFAPRVTPQHEASGALFRPETITSCCCAATARCWHVAATSMGRAISRS